MTWPDLLNGIMSTTWRTQLTRLWRANPWLPIPERTDHTIPALIWQAWHAEVDMDYLDFPTFYIRGRVVNQEYFLNYLKVPT